MSDKKRETGRKWDGKSRVSNDLYRKRFDEIFKNKKKENKESDELRQRDRHER
jgi:hypothetical protein